MYHTQPYIVFIYFINDSKKVKFFKFEAYKYLKV